MAIREKEMKKENVLVSEIIDKMVLEAQKAQEEFLKLDQEKVDKIVEAMALTGIDQHMKLAKLAVEETKRGIYEDKMIKNLFSTEYVFNKIREEKTVGVIEENKEDGYKVVAEPIGVIAGVTPVTNPTSTTMFKILIAIKTRNPIIFSFHPSAQKSSVKAASLLRDAAVEVGAPKNCIQWIETPSIEATKELIDHPDIALTLATGGGAMVKSAYSTGKPALGVGPGNVPCYIEKSANIKRAVTDLILSKTFDNGMICASEQSVIIDKEIADTTIKYMRENGCYFLNKEERKKLEEVAIDNKKASMNPKIVGQSAETIAKMAGISVPKGTKILVAHIEGVGSNYPLSREKLSPILACYLVKNGDEGIKRCVEITEFGGLGHSAVIHSNNQDFINKFGEKVRVGRLIVNSPSTFGAIGDIYNSNIPSLTLGCGSMGNNSTTDNVNIDNLINKKRMAFRKTNMQWFKIPPKIYFEPGSISYLSQIKDMNRVMIVTDQIMVDLGYVEKALYHLKKQDIVTEVFSDVEPDPSVETVLNGARAMERFKPNGIIALGGGSAMDAAKGMWLFYEHPNIDFKNLRMKFLDIRKRTFKFPKLGYKAKLIAIPTTSGTGSEVTSFTVITDKENNIKYPLADYELTPDIAIIDSDFVMTVPQAVTADTGLDVLTHALEAYVSVMASDYSDGLALKAIELVFDYLPEAYKNGKDALAREKMHNASCIAGMAFTNAFLGINHSLAHKIGGEFYISHGRANAVLLPHIIKYNSEKPSKFASFPKYEHHIAAEKYAKVARYLGLKATTVEEGVESLINAVKELMKEVGIPTSYKECGIEEKIYNKKIGTIAENAFEDQCTPANPRMPLISEMEEILKKAYKG